MATSKSDIKRKIAELRHEILSYKPGEAVPCDDDELVFPDRLVIGVIDVQHHISSPRTYIDIVRALRRALHGVVGATKDADRRGKSTEDQEEYLTDSISVIKRNYKRATIFSLDAEPVTEEAEEYVNKLAAKVGCFVVFPDPEYYEDGRAVIKKIKEITGRYPIVSLYLSEDEVKREQKWMREEGIVEVYEIPKNFLSLGLSDTEQLQLLSFISECLRKGDVVLANNSKQLTTNPVHKFLYDKAKKDITENQKKIKEIRQHEQVEESLQQEMKKLQMKLEESSARCEESFVDENARLKNEIVREKGKREQAELAIAENDKMAKNSQEMYKQREAEFAEELKAKEQKIKAQEDKCKEREETARREVEKIKKEKEEERGRAAQLTKEVESNQRRVNSLVKLVEEKELNEASLKQQVNCLEMKIEEERARLEKENLSVESALNKLKSEKERVEQLQRETWKLRTKIQLESEIRSEERKMKAETSQWSFIPWISSGKQTQTSTSLSEDPSNRGSRGSDEMQAGKELPDDEFAEILKQIADDLYDEAKIDSLGSQLGILQGDIQRALMTNVRFNRVTSEGTRHMLQQWREGVSIKDERIELRRALEAAKLLDLADHYLPQEGPTWSEHPRKVEASRGLSGENGSASKQRFAEVTSKYEDTPSRAHAAKVTRSDEPNKLDDPQGQSGKDGSSLAHGSLRGRTEVEKTTATVERSSPDKTSYMNEEENEGANQQSEESSNHSTTEDMPSGEMFSDETSTSNENQIEYITTKFDDLVSNLIFSDAYREKLYFLLFAKVIIDIR